MDELKAIFSAIDKFFETIAKVVVNTIGFCILIAFYAGVPIIIVGACLKYLMS